MNYSGLYTAEAIFFLIMALWFAKQLKFFSLFKKINDSEGILLPTIVLFTGLFLIPYLYTYIPQGTVAIEILKSSTPIIAIATFFLGQYATERANRKKKEEEEKIAGKRILYLLQEFIESDALSKSEHSLNLSNPTDDNLEKFRESCVNTIEYIECKISEIKTDQSIFNSSYRESFIRYLRVVDNFFKNYLENNKFSHCFQYETTIHSFYHWKYQAYAHKLHLCKHIIKDKELLRENLSFLELRQESLIRCKNNRQYIIENHKELLLQAMSGNLLNEEVNTKRKELEGKYPYLKSNYYYENLEQSVITDVNKIINEYS